MDEQLALFDVADYVVARVVRAPRKGRPRVRRLTGLARIPCDDCITVLHLNKWVGTAPLPAAWLRTDEDGNLWLCHPHYQDMHLLEGRGEHRQ